MLDDPLSAVDAKVGDLLFEKCICELLLERGAAVILVTHQLQFLDLCDRVLVLSGAASSNEDKKDASRGDDIPGSGGAGRVLGIGSYEELASQGIKFAHAVAPPLLDHSGEAEELPSSKGLSPVPEYIASHKSNSKQAPARRHTTMRVAETREQGMVTKTTYVTYIRRAAGLGGAVFLAVAFIAAQTNEVMCTWFLAYWVDSPPEHADEVRRP